MPYQQAAVQNLVCELGLRDPEGLGPKHLLLELFDVFLVHDALWPQQRNQCLKLPSQLL